MHLPGNSFFVTRSLPKLVHQKIAKEKTHIYPAKPLYHSNESELWFLGSYYRYPRYFNHTYRRLSRQQILFATTTHCFIYDIINNWLGRSIVGLSAFISRRVPLTDAGFLHLTTTDDQLLPNPIQSAHPLSATLLLYDH